MSLDRAGTETEAANLALGHLGQPEIADILGTGLRARTMRRFFAAARDSTLREKWWRFAKANVIPSADAADSAGFLKKRYVLPADCLRVRYLEDGAGGVFDQDSGEWDMEGGVVEVGGAQIESVVLVTNVAAPLVVYTRRVTTVSLWDAVFLEGFGYRLAGMAARTLGRSAAKAGALEGMARDRIATASAIDSKEKSSERVQPVPSFLTARRGLRRSSFGR